MSSSGDEILISGFKVIIFFFSSRRRHTRLVRDWSSDVCSSDLGHSDIRPSDKRKDRSWVWAWRQTQ